MLTVSPGLGRGIGRAAIIKYPQYHDIPVDTLTANANCIGRFQVVRCGKGINLRPHEGDRGAERDMRRRHDGERRPGDGEREKPPGDGDKGPGDGDRDKGPGDGDRERD